MRYKWWVIGAAFVVAVVFLADYWQTFVVHLSQETGTSNEGSRSYAYWSGFGSVFPWSMGVVTGVIAITLGGWHHHNCHVKGCLRLGHPVDGTPYVACPKHHPAHHGDKRGVSVERIHEAHKRASDRR